MLSGSLHTFNNLRTFCQSFAVLHSICTRRVGRTVCTWMSCTMSGNFDFYSPFIIRVWLQEQSVGSSFCLSFVVYSFVFPLCLSLFAVFSFVFSPVYALPLYSTATTPSEKFLHILFVLFHSVHSTYKAFPSLEPW